MEAFAVFDNVPLDRGVETKKLQSFRQTDRQARHIFAVAQHDVFVFIFLVTEPHEHRT